MDQDELSRVFQPFAQAGAATTRDFGGTGLGLAITQNFVHLIGGRLHVTSGKGEGTKFTLRIPRNLDLSVAA